MKLLDHYNPFNIIAVQGDAIEDLDVVDSPKVERGVAIAKNDSVVLELAHEVTSASAGNTHDAVNMLERKMVEIQDNAPVQQPVYRQRGPSGPGAR